MNMVRLMAVTDIPITTAVIMSACGSGSAAYERLMFFPIGPDVLCSELIEMKKRITEACIIERLMIVFIIFLLAQSP